MVRKNVAITGVTGALSAKVIADTLERGRSSLVIVPGRKRSERLVQDLSFFCDREIVLLPPDDDVFVRYEAKNQDQEVERSKVLDRIRKNPEILVVAPASGAIKWLPKHESYEKDVLEFYVGDEVSVDDLKSKLVEIGYDRSTSVYVPGQFSVRGGIIDIFTPHLDSPYRIELFGDEVDSIRTFDVESQRSIENLREAIVSPITTSIDSHLAEAVGKDWSREHEYIWDYMKECLVFIEDPERIGEYLDLRFTELWNDLNYLVEKDKAVKEEGERITGPSDFEKVFDLESVYFLMPFAKELKWDVKLTDLKSYQHIPVTSYNNHMEILEKDIKNYSDKGFDIIIVASSESREESLREFVRDRELKRVSVIGGFLSSGMIIPDEKLCYISDNNIFDSTKILGKKKRRFAKGKPIQAFSELKPGEYVVHDNYGIGIFQGIEEMNDGGSPKDYLKIRYQGQAVLYVPVERMDVVQKYIGSEGKTPKVNRLGSEEWKRTKERARRAIDSMMDELIDLYAKRKLELGHAFSEDTVWQREFEDSFPYQETEDQLKAVEEIKRDMEAEEPMDRLLCGDVGYGKTEVAARAIFKCMIEGKQAAVLVPTTILAGQHYNTLKERFKNYPFRIELMSRFRSDKELSETAKGLAKGSVDLVIGTHRVLSKDVSFRDLGLLVVDEEQRFGVGHKESIKKLKTGVDVLTLSATPIPRTLNMSLTGIRDMSLITEPPEERYPVQTYVLEEDDGIIREVIHRELDRGGQVFIVYNRVRGIVRIAERIRSLVPDATVSVGHGQMGEASLEEVMRAFVAGETNVLVATTIIESGLDIPNANTLIVLDSDKCGLSQLYQLRGRVGRSNRIAYAYLMYQKDKVLTDVAEKRLRAVREFTEFGAGFRIAMRDMELRGAGNILGAEQSGHMLDVGYEMYARLVDEASKRAQGIKVHERNDDMVVEIKTAANIPGWYIEDESTRLTVYKRIADIETQKDSEDAIDELIDRFGEIPKETLNLIKISTIRSMAQAAGILGIHEKNGTIYLNMNPNETISPYVIVGINDAFGRDVFYHSGVEPYFSFKAESDKKLDFTISVLEMILNPNES